MVFAITLKNISAFSDIFFNAARGYTVNVASATNMRTTEKTATTTKQSHLWMESRNSHCRIIRLSPFLAIE
ncbi:hypothetical protein DXF93_15885 [Escherichia coli]|nr:hypothetical protein DXF93_15885 [Escherichia coli]